MSPQNEPSVEVLNGALRVLVQELAQMREQLGQQGEKHYEAGKMFIRLKELAPRGQYRRWATDTGYSLRHAEKLAQLARGVDAGAVDKEELKSLTIDKIYRAIRIGKRAANESKTTALTLRNAPSSPDVHQGDALAYLASLPASSVPFIVSDPPYGIGLKYDGFTEASDFIEHWKWFGPIWKEMIRVLANPGCIVLWQHQNNLSFLRDWYKGCVVDALNIMVRGERTWIPLVRYQKGTCKVKLQGSWVGPITGHNESVEYYGSHPCPKNTRECEAVITRYTNEGGIVLDPFCGTGSILVACKNTGRQFLGIDQSAKYVKIAKQRLS